MDAKPEVAFKPGWAYGLAVTVLLIALTALGIWLGRSSVRGPARQLGSISPPADLSPAARAELHARMRKHAADMLDLSDAVVVLDEPRIDRAAAQVAMDATAFGQHGRTDLDARLSPRFTMLQQQLATQAGALAAAARERSPERIAAAYGQLASTCVRCHADYRAGH